MHFSRTEADIFVPDGGEAAAALARTTHLCVAAHQDDIEIMAHEGIARCYDAPEKAFTGVVVTNGAGSPRTGVYSQFTDAEMQTVRREEQRRAATLGRYALQLQLAHPSADVKTRGHADVVGDLAAIFGACRPEVVYLHQPADKHDTHVAVLGRCVEALRSLPPAQRPGRVLGCEVWRDLDWLVDEDKVALDASGRPQLARQLLEVFDSQISGGKRYDLAAIGRRAANATFHTSHATDRCDAITWAMDLTPLMRDDTLTLERLVTAHVDRLRADVLARVERFG